MMLSYSMLLVDRQALSEHTTTSSSTKSLGQALGVALVKPGAYLSESYSSSGRIPDTVTCIPHQRKGGRGTVVTPTDHVLIRYPGEGVNLAEFPGKFAP